MPDVKRQDSPVPEEHRAGPWGPCGSREEGCLTMEQKPELDQDKSGRGRRWHLPGTSTCTESHQQPLALDGGAGLLPPTMVLLVCSSEVSLLGVSRAHVSLRPWLRAQQKWARSPGPQQVKGSVPTGGAPAGHCGCARAATLHQLGGLRDLLCERGTGPGGVPDEPERLPELLDRADGYVVPPVWPGQEPQEGASVPCPCRLAPRGWYHLGIPAEVASSQS